LSITAILSALPEEQHGLIEQLVDPVRIGRAGREFWRGELQGQPVVLALSRVGKVAAATTATTLIEAFGVSRMVFTGVAGGVGPGVQVGDVVLATGFVQHDMDASPLFPRYEIPLSGRANWPCDDFLSALLLKAAHQGLTGADGEFASHARYVNAQIHSGLIATGDQFVCSASAALQLVNDLTVAGMPPLAVEMEGAAVAQVCADYGVPFAAVRTISDRADDQAHVDFPAFVADVASPYARAIVRRFMGLLLL
jgi:adenosylhomocysteine nucleosidase